MKGGHGVPGKSLPGETGLWVFIFADLGLFFLFFVLAAQDMAVHREDFQTGQAGLLTWVGAVNTVVLLTGSWAVAMGTRVANTAERASQYLKAAALSGVLFLGLKVFEYAHSLGAGHVLTENRFYMWYYALTAYHALHVLVGVGLLWLVARRYATAQRPGHLLVEAAGCYWHLVDLLWIEIFLILYLL